MQMNAATEAIAGWVVAQSLDDLDPRAVEIAKMSMIDTVGCIFAGYQEPAARIVRGCVTFRPDLPTAVVARRNRATAWDAALVSGTAGHALDYDDYDLRSYAHPSVVLVPALLAAGQEVDASGAQLVAAYVIGYQVMQCIGSVVNPESYLAGFHGTGTVGTIGAAAAVAKLFSQSREQVQTTLGIAGSLVAGLRSNFGTDVKPLHAGRAAQSGVFAAHLSSRGLTASTNLVETERGIVDALAPGGRDSIPSAVEQLLDGTISIVKDPPTLKVFPSCGATHAAISGTLELAARLDDTELDQIDRVVVEAPHLFPTILIHHRPSTGLEAKFSMEGCVALALADRRVGMSQFDEAAVRRPAVQDLIGRVELRGDDRMEETYLRASSLPAVVTITARGHDHRVEVLDAPGSKANPISMDDVLAKFDDCVAASGLRVDRDAVLGSLSQLEDLDHLDPLTSALSGAAPREGELC